MATLVLKYESKVIKEFPIQKSTVVIGRAPGNEIVIDNLAVSGSHARVCVEEGKFIVEDLNSLNGTFLNGQRIRKSPLKEGDQIAIGKHTLEYKEAGGLNILMMMPADRSSQAARADQTVVLDTKQRRDFLAKATAIAEGADPETKTQIACLVTQAGKTDQPEYILTSKIYVIGKDKSASVRLKGWFLPRVAAIITRRGSRHFDIAPSEKGGVTRVNSQVLTAPQELNEGDVIQIKRIQLRFHYRE
jgi:pSer/pThr/pTyr-binding forkhead associated (FHA) protein